MRVWMWVRVWARVRVREGKGEGENAVEDAVEGILDGHRTVNENANIHIACDHVCTWIRLSTCVPSRVHVRG